MNQPQQPQYYNTTTQYPQTQQTWSTMNQQRQPVQQPTWTQPSTYATAPPPTQPPRSYFSGRLINALSEVSPNEVSADGSLSVFPTMDRSYIYLSEMTGNGTISTTTYVRVDEKQSSELNAVMDRLDSLERFIKRTVKPRHNKQQSQKQEENNGH